VATQVYLQPQSLNEALALLAEHGPATLVMAGGTLAVPLVNKGVSRPEKVLGLRRAGLNYVRQVGGSVHIGAAATLTQVRREAGIPLLAEAVKNIGGWAIQNMGTAGGNLFAPPPAGDLAVVFLALDAKIVLANSRRRERIVPLAEFYTGFLATVIEPDELVVEIQVPRPAGKTALLKHGRLYTNTPAIVSVAVQLLSDDGRARDVRIALNAVGPHPLRAVNAEAAIKGKALDTAAIAAAAGAAAAECEPFTDPIATEWYRRKMTGVFVRRALEQAAAPGPFATGRAG
jgi:aerobic carbon-monoxide dehydrogenase medium subunit